MPHIEKDAGQPYLTRFRVLHLFEADYNSILKLLYGKCLVRHGDKYEALNDQQWGSRPQRTTMDALFLSRLSRDLATQLKANTASMDNNATGCYDRIVVALGMIACRRRGMPEMAIRTHTESLKVMKYSVKTVYGISAENYSGTVFEPLFGTGQGSGASPAIWLALVVIILNAYDELAADGYSFSDPWNDLTELWKVFAFVDDTLLGFIDTCNRSLPEMIETLEGLAQTWERLLHCSGGALNLSKCFWSIQYWEWKNGRPQLCKVEPHEADLVMYSGKVGEASIIRRIENDEATRVLGVWANFKGTFGVHTEKLKLKIDGMAVRLAGSKLLKAASRRFYDFYYLPSVRYSLPVTSISEAELRQIKTKFKVAILNKLGLPYTYPNGVTFAPRSVMGIDLTDLCLDQGIYNIKAFLDFVGTDQKAGNVMLISLCQLQVECGMRYHLLENTAPMLPYLTETCWINRLRQFCGAQGITITVLSARRPLASRGTNDVFLMTVAATLTLKPRELEDINL
jgi:hypothetical protein